VIVLHVSVNKMDKTWLVTNLELAHGELEEAIAEIKQLPEEDEFLAKQLLGEVYLKLNYAWNSRNMPDNLPDKYYEFIRYPKEMDIYTGD